MDQEQVAGLFYNSALTEAVAFGYRLGQEADGDLRNDASQAAESTFARGLGEVELNSEIERGVRAFRYFVDNMIGAHQEIYRDRPEMLLSKILGEGTYWRVRDALCPGFYPFC